jgi:hypothetical protein
MWSIFEYLTSPFQMEELSVASQWILGEVVDLERLPDECCKVIAQLELEQHSNFETQSETSPKPLISILESGGANSFLDLWEKTFSELISPAMHLFGSTEPQEVTSYQTAFRAYFARINKETQE